MTLIAILRQATPGNQIQKRVIFRVQLHTKKAQMPVLMRIVSSHFIYRACALKTFVLISSARSSSLGMSMHFFAGHLTKRRNSAKIAGVAKQYRPSAWSGRVKCWGTAWIPKNKTPTPLQRGMGVENTYRWRAK